MNAGNYHGVVNGSLERNGTTPRGAVSPRVRRPATAKRIEPPAKPLPELAPFIKTEAQAQNAPMWPVHPVMWLQPQLRPAVPAESGLSVERKHTVPAPDALRFELTPVNHPASPEMVVRPVPPQIQRQLPASGLAPLGWDPRVASFAAGKEDQV
ncbi:MAG TPA: hypothetical protein VLY24_29480 [Bryobacteraceae bacterium]|nr:hypothetical protein [Bryobacteraceae bacterium]